jgi:hypothetical protein
MLRRICLAFGATAVLAGFPANLPAQQVVTLSNGDQLTGTLVGIDGAMWAFNYGGQDVQFAAADVTTFTAPDPIGIRLSDGSIVAASVTTTAAGLRLDLADGTSRIVAATDLAAVGSPDELDKLQPVHIGLFSPFFKFWGTTISLGSTIKDGNTNTNIGTIFFDLRRETNRDRLGLTFQANNESDRLPGGEKVTTAESWLANLRGDIFVSGRIFAYGLTRQSSDKFAGIDLRSVYQAGGGYQFIENDNTDLRAALGGGARYENVTDDGSETVGILSLNGSFRQNLGPFVYELAADGSPAVDDFENFQIIALTSLTATILKGFGFRIGLLLDYNNRPPEGREKHDLELTTALSYSIGK